MTDETKEIAEADYPPEQMVYGDGGFHDSVDAFVDHWECVHDDKPLPRTVEATSPIAFHLSAERIVESECESDNYREDIAEQIDPDDIGRLQRVLDDWCATLGPGTVSYTPSGIQIVIAPREPNV